jgi:hypothetical protein
MERATPPTRPTEPTSGEGAPVQVPRDWRAVIVACGGLAAIVLIVIVGVAALPDGRAATGGESVVAIASAAVTAIGTVVAAYFGIRAANVAREESTKAVERSQIYASELAGSRPDEAASAGRRADERIRGLGLSASPPAAPVGRRRRS